MKNFLLIAVLFSTILCSAQTEKPKAQPAPKKDPTIALSRASFKKDSTNALKLDPSVVSFVYTFQRKGTLISDSCLGNRLSKNACELMMKATKGTTFYIENIKARSKEGKVVKMPTQIYRLND